MKEIYGYFVTKDGRLFNKKGKQLKLFDSGKGYLQARIWNGEKCLTKYIHRLVWEAYMGPIPEGYQINHKDENKYNNDLSNLEVCTPLYNINYGTGNERRLATLKAKGLKIGEDSHQRKIEYMREYNKRPEVKERMKQYNKDNRLKLNEQARLYRLKKKESKMNSKLTA